MHLTPDLQGGLRTRSAVASPPATAVAGREVPRRARLERVPTAIVYCEGEFARIDGKTANGLVRHSEAYRILSVIDSRHAGRDSGLVLDEKANRIPILRDLESAVNDAPLVPDVLIYGAAPSTGRLSPADREVVLDAIGLGMNIVSGLHEHLCDDEEIAARATAKGVSLRDVRKPKPGKDMRLFDGSVADVDAIRIAVLGTDCAIGKRTTATILARALNDAGVRTVLVGTGQTGLMQGARYGVAMDATPPQFCCGELEGAIVAADRNERPDVILIEGQGALSHPAFCTSAFILRGGQPDAVILQHAPRRRYRCDFPAMAMPDLIEEIALIEAFAATRVVGVTLNHEEMDGDEIDEAIARLERRTMLPATDALSRPAADLAKIVFDAFPELPRRSAEAAE
ncbi:MAG: DUF1611 domain-containing protein [Pseudomonadota bacterium]